MSPVPSEPSWFARLASKVDHRELPASEWLRSGWPRVVPLTLLAALPLALAGPVRFVTGVSPCVALVLAIAMAAIGVLPFVRALWVSDRSTRALIADAVVVVVGLFAVWVVYNGDFGGLTSYIGADSRMAIDAASHVHEYHKFIYKTPEVYEGFVSLYGLWDPLRRLAGDLILPARLSFVMGVFVVAAVPCVISFSVLHTYRPHRRAYVTGAVVCLAAAIAVQYWLILPLQAIHHMGGFWAHLFGLIPLFSIWLVDALVRQRLLRVASVLFVVVLYRFTYGLNLTDLLATAGVLLVMEGLGKNLPRATRIAIGVTALVAFAASVYSYEQLKPMLNRWGWIVRHDRPQVAGGEVLVVVAIWISAAWRPARAWTAGSGIVRALRFPLVFGISNLVFLAVIQRLPPRTSYYVQKYSLHAVVLTASCLVVVASFWAATCVARWNRRTASGVVLVVALVAFGQRSLRTGFTSFQEGFREQAFGSLPYHRAQPWYDPIALDKIHQTLETERKAFGGYLTPFWPMRCFMNALFDHGKMTDPKPTEAPGHCVFWDADQYPKYDNDPRKQCSSYPMPWKAAQVGTLCSRCY